MFFLYKKKFDLLLGNEKFQNQKIWIKKNPLLKKAKTENEVGVICHSSPHVHLVHPFKPMPKNFQT